MNPEELQKQIALYYSKLTPELQVMFSSMDWLEALKKISTEYSLTDAQIETLGTETTLMLLGMVPLDEYEEKIKTEVGLPNEKTEKMLGEINEAILKDFQPQLVEVFANNVKGLAGDQSNIDENLDARFDKLPEETRKIILTLSYHEKLYTIAQANKLNVEQMGKLEEMTTDVLTGALHADMLEQRLINRLGVTTETIKKILNEINDKILRPLRERMEINFGKPKSVEAEIKPTENTPNPINIRIIKPQINTLELKSGPPKPNPLILQKLSGSFQAPTTKTQYSLNNLSKPEARKQGEATPVPIKSYPPKSDPYRINPEE